MLKERLFVNYGYKKGIYRLTEYLGRESLATTRHEYISKRIIELPHSNKDRNIICANIAAIIGANINSLSSQFRAFAPNTKILIPRSCDVLYSDVAVTFDTYISEIPYLKSPILLVEVLSKSSSTYNSMGKFLQFKKIGSLKEYVLIDPTECYVEVWFLEEKGLWRETIITNLEQNLHLRSVDISILMKDIYKSVGVNSREDDDDYD